MQATRSRRRFTRVLGTAILVSVLAAFGVGSGIGPNPGSHAALAHSSAKRAAASSLCTATSTTPLYVTNSTPISWSAPCLYYALGWDVQVWLDTKASGATYTYGTSHSAYNNIFYSPNMRFFYLPDPTNWPRGLYCWRVAPINLVTGERAGLWSDFLGPGTSCFNKTQ
jgi:hypothetical protein